MPYFQFPITVAVLATFFCQTIAADEWPSWRGPKQNGVAADDSFPLRWDEDTNIAWTVALPGRGASTPAVTADHIFLTSADDDANSIVCIDMRGNIRWTSKIGAYREGKHKKATGANPSPVTDGSHVYCYFKSGDLACLDFDGAIIWQTNLQQRFAADTLWWDLGTSPVLAGDLLVVACMQTGDSYLAAFDKTSGELRWKVERNLPAPLESNQSYTTPCVIDRDGQPQLIVLGADFVTAHELQGGTEVWRFGGLNPDQHKMFRSISSPVANSSAVFFCYARGDTLTAVRTDGKGDITDSHIAWTREAKFSDVPTPALNGDRLYVCSDKGTVMCVDATSGEERWSTSLPKFRGNVSASPIVSGDRLYVTIEDGKTFVMDASNGELLGQGEIEGLIVATPVLVDGAILLRTPERLICVRDS